jgi:hypothetical protein
VSDDPVEKIDPQVLRRVASTSRATQRWLKTALQTIRTMPPAREPELEPRPRPLRPRPEPMPALEPQPEAETFPPDLDDLLTRGRGSLKDQLEARPELAEELEGLADIIEMLRGLGEERRQRGRDILRDEILGADGEEPDEEEEPDEDV